METARKIEGTPAGARRSRGPRLVEDKAFNHKNASKELQECILQHNEAQAGKGLKYLRSFLSNIVGIPGWEAAKPLLDAVNGSNPASAVVESKWLLTQEYEDADKCFTASQIALSVKKYPFAGLPEVARANGLAKFEKGERRNRHMNALLRARRRAGVMPFYLHSIRRYVHRLLGDGPDFQLWASMAGWGPGANVGVSGQFTNLARKLLADEWTVTPAALPYALTIAKRLPMFWEMLDLQVNRKSDHNTSVVSVDPDEFTIRFMRKVKVVQYNKIATAPKDADEDRIIASEPLLNQLVQVAADQEMRLRLRRFGIDLRDQERNKELAREGSLCGLHQNARCTIDLSNASGSIFIELVREVTAYCPDWFTALNAIRSPCYVDSMAGTLEKRYHMFSSMGNGFTFPLETIIFAAICSAAHDYCGTAPDFRCYGDDIIVRQNEALVVLEILRDLGFKANASKTFIIGPFRESCGSDWFNGVAVRPIVFDTPLESIEERIRIHNALARLPNVQIANMLSNACRNWFPPFMAEFVRPFADHTDEAVDGRFIYGPYPENRRRCTTYDSPSWYGLTFKPLADKEIGDHRRYPGALLYAAVDGATSSTPFTARRETRLRVARFSHSGNTSSWIPAAPPIHCNDGFIFDTSLERLVQLTFRNRVQTKLQTAA